MTAMTDTPDLTAAPAAAAQARRDVARTLYWSVRRELWENRAIWVAPMAAAGVVLFGYLIAMAQLPQRFPAARPGHHHAMTMPPPEAPYAFAGIVILATAAISGLFYCLGALGAERRDRSILFWKSLPVSDGVTVVSKLALPMVVLPAVTYATIVATILTILELSAAANAMTGSPNAAAVTHFDLLKMLVDFAYFVVTATIWYAPAFSWCLLVGGWARRVAFLWAAGVPVALMVIEQIAFGSSYVGHVVAERLGGGLDQSFSVAPHAPHTMGAPFPDPLGFIASPGLWIGIGLAAALVAAAIWLRRTRDPI
jgi:ABC-2 type transport system permease protein